MEGKQKQITNTRERGKENTSDTTK